MKNLLLIAVFALLSMSCVDKKDKEEETMGEVKVEMVEVLQDTLNATKETIVEDTEESVEVVE